MFKCSYAKIVLCLNVRMRKKKKKEHEELHESKRKTFLLVKIQGGCFLLNFWNIETAGFNVKHLSMLTLCLYLDVRATLF